MGVYLRPRTLEEALAALAARPLTVFAGGTDIYPARATLQAWGQAFPEDLLDIGGLAALQGIAESSAEHSIGASVTWTRLIEAPLPPHFDALKLAAREVGGAQIQNRGTLAGNLCNASPAADGVPPLLALDAQVVLRSTRGERRLPLPSFILGNRRTARDPDELLTAIIVPKPALPVRATFLKLGARRYLVISIAMVAAAVEIDAGRIATARIAVGACAPVAQRLPALEAALAGQPAGPALAQVPRIEHLAPLAPIDDVRADAGYRRDSALVLVRRALARLAAGQAMDAAA